MYGRKKGIEARAKESSFADDGAAGGVVDADGHKQFSRLLVKGHVVA